MQKKMPHPVDVHVGGRLRIRRVLLGMSQEKLGEKLGLTFQQVQKYEKGSNRIGASRLFDVSRILDVPVSFFYEGLGEEAGAQVGLAEPGQSDYLAEFAQSSDCVQLMKAFLQIKQPHVRRSVIQFVRNLADAKS